MSVTIANEMLYVNGPWTLPLCPHIGEPLQLTSSLPFPHHFCAIQKTWRLRQFWRTWKIVDKAFWTRFRTSSVQFSRSVVSDSSRPHGSQHTRPPCSSPTPGVYSNSSPLSRWPHPLLSPSPPAFNLSQHQGLFPMSQLFAWGGQSIGVSASTSVRPVDTQDWCPLGWTGWISLKSKGLSKVFSNTTVQKHKFIGTQLSSQSNSHIHTWPLEKP